MAAVKGASPRPGKARGYSQKRSSKAMLCLPSPHTYAKGKAERHRPYSLPAPGRPSSTFRRPEREPRARGTPRVRRTRRTSTPRSIKAC